MRKLLLIIVFAALLMMGCVDDSSSDSGALFDISVKDASGEPVSGLEVAVTNYGVHDTMSSGRPQTTIRFTLKESCHTLLEIFNQKNELVRVLLNNNMDSGYHNVVWDGKNDNGDECGAGGTRVYSYKLTCTGGEEDFSDTKEMCVLLYPGEQGSMIGYTDQNGEFIYEDKLSFPHLFNPDPQPKLDCDGNYWHDISFSDSVLIRLHDPIEGEYMEFIRRMPDDTNHFDLVWDDPIEDEGYREEGRFAQLSEFTGEYDEMAQVVRINWSTDIEYDFYGFNLYRRYCSWGDIVQINNDIIPGEGDYIGADYELVDEDIEIAEIEYYYFLEGVDESGDFYELGDICVEIEEQENEVPVEYQLHQNYPNPFN